MFACPKGDAQNHDVLKEGGIISFSVASGVPWWLSPSSPSSVGTGSLMLAVPKHCFDTSKWKLRGILLLPLFFFPDVF